MADDTERRSTRLSVNINAECAAALRKICDRRGISVTEAVRRAIAVLKFAEDTVADGKKLLVQDGDKTQQIEML